MHCNCALWSVKGEDRYACCTMSDECRMLGVIDGHGGSAAAEVCRRSICDERSPPDMLDMFAALHDECLRLPCRSGAALTVCLVRGDNVTCANVGDAHALVVTQTSFYWMTVSDRLQDNASERFRVAPAVNWATRSSDGRRAGPPRMYPGGLACSRSIGDSDCPHVSCAPHLCEATLEADDVLVIGSDGLWDSIPLSRIVRVARQTRCAQSILRSASKDIGDDATVIVASRQPQRACVSLGMKLFFRTSSSSSVSSCEEEVPNRRVIKVVL